MLEPVNRYLTAERSSYSFSRGFRNDLTVDRAYSPLLPTLCGENAEQCRGVPGRLSRDFSILPTIAEREVVIIIIITWPSYSNRHNKSKLGGRF